MAISFNGRWADRSNRNETFKRNSFSLGFCNPNAEKAFIASRFKALALNFSRTMMLCSVVLTQMLLVQLWAWPTADLPIRADAVSLGCMLVITLLWSIVPRLPGHEKLMTFQFLEVSAACVMLLLLARWVAVQLLMTMSTPGAGTQLDKEQRRYVLCGFALLLDTIVTTSHLVLPVRWSLMLFVDIVFIISFVLFAVSYPGLGLLDLDWTVISSFVALVMGANIGLRTLEHKERELFMTVVDERTLRIQAELQGCTPASDRQPDACSRVLSETSPTDTENGSVFNLAEGDDEDGFLARLSGLGKSEHWLISHSELTVLENEVLGQGGQGIVLAGTFCRSPVAIKRCTVHSGLPGLMSVMNELRILRHLRHPNIVLFHGVCLGSPAATNVMIVLERLKGTDLSGYVMKFLHAWKPSSPHAQQQLRILRMVCEALIYLGSRSPRIVHGDLTPRNIMVERREGQPFAKLLDFGLSRKVARNATLHGGTARYFAPEILLKGNRPTTAADVFSLGRLIFFVASGRRPLAPHHDKHIVESARQGKVLPLAFAPSTQLLSQLQPIVQSCTEHEAELRPTVEEVHDLICASALPVDALQNECTGLALQAPRSRGSSAGSTGATSRNTGGTPSVSVTFSLTNREGNIKWSL